MLPHNSVVIQFTSEFQGVPTVLPHAPVFFIGETTFATAQINLINNGNTSHMIQVNITQTDSQGENFGKTYLRILFFYNVYCYIGYC